MLGGFVIQVVTAWYRRRKKKPEMDPEKLQEFDALLQGAYVDPNGADAKRLDLLRDAARRIAIRVAGKQICEA